MTLEQDKQWLLREKYHGVPSAAYEYDVAQLMKGEPLAYLIGSIPFLGCTIYLDSHPLIPRVETEFWTEHTLTHITQVTPRILDLCAGSGCIGVAVARAVPRAVVDFVEIDTTHHTTIKKNVEKNCPYAQTRVLGGDLFEHIPNERYDLILTNPPYIAQESDESDECVRTFEPHKALYGGPDGLTLITRIITTLPAHLTTTGQAWIEHEPEQTTSIAKLAAHTGLTHRTLLDQYGRERVSILTRA